MRKWAVPLTVLGVGGLGVLMFSERGRNAIRWMFRRMQEAPDRIAEWNETAQTEIDKIQVAINQLAESLRVNLAR
ncbi:MAG: hypothetical protein ABSD88_15560 [Candidatus Korobacteraceae bacterium]|jgi:hypothetical protein